MNTVSIIGRLANNPEVRTTTNGTTIANIRLAVPNPRNDDQPDWIPVTCIGKVADAVATYLTKGNRVAVTGRLTSSEWDDTDGNHHFRLDVTARTVDFLTTNNRTTEEVTS